MLKSSGRIGTNILLEAICKDKVHLAKFILDALDGKIVDSKTGDAPTPLISSILLPDEQTRSKFMELLLQRGASVNCQDQNGRTALSYACENGYLDAVKILVRNSADPEIVDTWGNTALMYAAAAGHFPVVDFLVRAFKRLGLQVDRRNNVGNSAAEVAKFLGHKECLCALTSNARNARETDRSGARGSAQPRVGSGCTAEERFEKRVGSLVRRAEVLQIRPFSDDWLGGGGKSQLRPAGRRGGSLILRSGLPSMDSIEEFDREHDSSPPSPQEPAFSGIFSPKPPPRPTDLAAFKLHKAGDSLPTHDELLPHLRHRSVFFSPRPGKHSSKSSAPPASVPSLLGILLTPIPTNESEGEKPRMTDVGVRRFHDSYYQKRCSLPASALCPTPPDRTRMRLRKTQTTRRRATSPTEVETSALTSPVAPSAATFSVLGGKLPRRFTFPGFRKGAKGSEDPARVSARIPRSETFPQGGKHPQVGSKSSIDSISAVKCEFDFRVPTPPT